MPSKTLNSNFKIHVMDGDFSGGKPSGLHSLYNWQKRLDPLRFNSGAEVHQWVHKVSEQKLYWKVLETDLRIRSITTILFSGSPPTSDGAMQHYKASTLWPSWMTYDEIKSALEAAYDDYEEKIATNAVYKQMKEKYELYWIGMASLKKGRDLDETTRIWIGAQKASSQDNVISAFPAVNNKFL